jgi:hypothetical protein
MTLVMALSVRAGADMRLLRAAVFTAVCVVLSAAAHTLASGHMVGWWPLLAGWLAVFGFAAPLAGRERSLPGIAAGLVVGQLGLHALFNAGEMCAQPAAASRGAGLMTLAGRLLCDDHGVRLTPATAERVVRSAGLDPSRASGMSGMSGVGTTAHTSTADAMGSYSLSMVIGHLLAALVAGWLLRGGEAALWRLVRLSARSLRYAFALVRVLVAGSVGEAAAELPRQARFAEGQRRPHTVRLRHSVARRGPPALGLAA